jgi:hypothetical protein
VSGGIPGSIPPIPGGVFPMRATQFLESISKELYALIQERGDVDITLVRADESGTLITITHPGYSP